MKKLWFIPFLVGMLIIWIDTPAQAGLILPKSLPTVTEMSGAGMTIGQKIEGSTLRLEIELQYPANIASYGFSMKFNPNDYEFVGVQHGLVLMNADGELYIVSPLTTIDTKKFLLTLEKKGNNWGEIQPQGLMTFTKSRETQAFESMAPFVPKPMVVTPKMMTLNNFPNPFNPSTEIRYTLPSAGPVQLTVYNMVGQVIRTLVNEHMASGEHITAWNATDNNGNSVAGGIYFYRISTPNGDLIRKMLLLK
ncbi:MAG: FlgD immunoglobulin-like domain containing protein [Patescibacteria group bacterium]